MTRTKRDIGGGFCLCHLVSHHPHLVMLEIIVNRHPRPRPRWQTGRWQSVWRVARIRERERERARGDRAAASVLMTCPPTRDGPSIFARLSPHSATLQTGRTGKYINSHTAHTQIHKYKNTRTYKYTNTKIQITLSPHSWTLQSGRRGAAATCRFWLWLTEACGSTDD